MDVALGHLVTLVFGYQGVAAVQEVGGFAGVVGHDFVEPGIK